MNKNTSFLRKIKPSISILKTMDLITVTKYNNLVAVSVSYKGMQKHDLMQKFKQFENRHWDSVAKKWYFSTSDTEKLVKLLESLDCMLFVETEKKDIEINEYISLIYLNNDKIAVKSSYSLHQKYKINDEYKKIKDAKYDADLKKWIFSKDNLNELRELFHKLKINVHESYEGGMLVNEADDIITITTDKYDEEFFKSISQLSDYKWLADKKAHSIAANNKAELKDILYKLKRKYFWVSVNDDKENKHIKIKIKRNKPSCYLSPPFTQQFDYTEISSIGAKEKKAKLGRKLNFD